MYTKEQIDSMIGRTGFGPQMTIVEDYADIPDDCESLFFRFRAKSGGYLYGKLPTKKEIHEDKKRILNLPDNYRVKPDVYKLIPDELKDLFTYYDGAYVRKGDAPLPSRSASPWPKGGRRRTHRKRKHNKRKTRR